MKKLSKSFVYAFNGLFYAFKTQLNFKIHCLAIVFVLVLGYYVKLNRTDWLWIALAIAIVLITELFNTAIEVFVDLVSPQRQTKAGIIKDVAAAAVLISALFALIIFVLIFTPKFN